MSETNANPGTPSNSLDELIALLLSINPVHLATKAIDEGGKALNQSRRVVELLISTLENTSVTMNNLN